VKKMKAEEKYNHSRDKLASFLSGDNSNDIGFDQSLPDEKEQEIFNYLKEMNNSRGDDKAVVDNAWNRLFKRLEEDNLLPGEEKIIRFSFTHYARIAAMIVIVAGLALTGRYVISSKMLSPETVFTTTGSEKNMIAELPDGSRAFLNRNSELTYQGRFGKNVRSVKLSGEAFFEITPDADRPFIIDAGVARVTVIGTSFNVMTNNGNCEVEVMVSTGKVLVTSTDGSNEITLEPGNIGVVGNNNSSKTVNTDSNYLSWNTNVLSYNGESLEKAFSDLKRVHDIDIVAMQDEILQKRITTVFDNQDPDTIITMICKTFNLTSEKSGDSYYISGK